MAEKSEHERREELIQRLGEALSDLQEACFCASWMCVTPIIEALCRKAIKTGKPQQWGWGELSVSAAQDMWAMAEELGGWSGPEPSGEDRFVVEYPFRSLDSDGLVGFRYGWDSSDL